MRNLINKPEPPLPLMLMIKFPLISVQPLYSARDASESIGSFSSSDLLTATALQTIKQQKIKIVISITSVIGFLSILLEAEGLNSLIYYSCLFLTFFLPSGPGATKNKDVIIEKDFCHL